MFANAAKYFGDMADFKKYPCTECPKRFLRPAELSRHVKTKHRPKPSLVCEWPGCFEQVKDQKSMARHGLRKHDWTKKESEVAACQANEQAKEVFALVNELVERVEAEELVVREDLEMEEQNEMMDVEEPVVKDVEQPMEVDVEQELMEQEMEAMEPEMEAVVDEDEVVEERKAPWWTNEEEDLFQEEEVEERLEMRWLDRRRRRRQEVAILRTIEQQEEPPNEPYSIRTLREMFSRINLY
ncbi:hypothetical protein CRE_23587 [Caenorhabditis remanei]|uniref:C2H2-type domain-containing protein n=1 Tax=Caenorhabditis remanei TaxID=31234 RepID=E3MVX7_CAERE|nr:hypothetical protein CRE_23587 [Caenorhabditis remanei]